MWGFSINIYAGFFFLPSQNQKKKAQQMVFISHIGSRCWRQTLPSIEQIFFQTLLPFYISMILAFPALTTSYQNNHLPNLLVKFLPGFDPYPTKCRLP